MRSNDGEESKRQCEEVLVWAAEHNKPLFGLQVVARRVDAGAELLKMLVLLFRPDATKAHQGASVQVHLGREHILELLLDGVLYCAGEHAASLPLTILHALRLFTPSIRLPPAVLCAITGRLLRAALNSGAADARCANVVCALDGACSDLAVGSESEGNSTQ